jgi:hypothetical protein
MTSGDEDRPDDVVVEHMPAHQPYPDVYPEHFIVSHTRYPVRERGPKLRFTREAWDAFVVRVKNGDFDFPIPAESAEPRIGDAQALAAQLSRKIREAGLDVVGEPMVDVSTGNVSVEIFDAAGKQFILTIQDPRPES